MTDPKNCKTLVELLLARAGSSKTITFIDGQDSRVSIAYADMLPRALARLAAFQAAGLQPGTRMIIQSADNALFLEAFWACLLGGIIAVPVAGGNTSEQRLKLFRIASTLNNAALYTDENNLQRLQQFARDNELSEAFDALSRSTVLSEMPRADAADATVSSPDETDTAFIQFSSGSTSTPKGIMLTHRNLVTNITAIIEGCGMSPDDSMLSWMPLTHDMGLIGFHLTPMVRDISHGLIATDLFVRRPVIWLSEAQRLKSTILCSPNFGLQHLLKSFKANRHEGLDLSSVRLLFNGAEPISVDLCETFMQTLHPCALHPSAMYPVYGLAEASLAVTFPPLDRRFVVLTLERSSLAIGQPVKILAGEERGLKVVSVGLPVPYVELCIRDDENSDCAENVVGHICIRGGNVTAGYYAEPELTAQTIDADGWLDTGDLGFLHEGQLYITGRAKDIIFINGQNVYPHDLEEIVVQAGLVERGRFAIASQRLADEQEETIVVFVVHRSELAALESLAADITSVLGKEAGLRVAAVAAVPRIPKTTSGKVQRFQLLREYEAGEYKALKQLPDTESTDAVQHVPDADSQTIHAVEQTSAATLLAICNKQVEGIQVGPDDNLFELGISSLTLAEIHASIEDTWPDKVDITDLFDYPTVAELAAFLDAKG